LRNDFRFFKTGRIESANILPQSFTRRSYNEEDVPLNFWHQTVEAKDVVLEVEKNCLSDVEEWLGIENFEHKNGKHLAYAKLPYDNGLVTKIISFGSGIKVVQPENLKEKVKLCAQEIMNNYK
jgi:predicted DNA-binding transcriptional regulator YafY